MPTNSTRPRRPPLAWRNLTESPPRLAASVAGAAFAVTLMFMEVGFRGALLDSMVAVARVLDGDLFLINKMLYTLAVPQQFPARRLEQARAFEGVTGASPVYVDTRRGRWRNPADGVTHRIRVIAYPPADNPLDIAPLREARDLLNRPDTVAVDTLSRRASYGDIAAASSSELSGRTVSVVAKFALGADFQNDGTVVTSDQTFFRIFPDRGNARGVDIGVVRASPGADVGKLAVAIRAALPPDVLVLTRAEFVAKEQSFWDKVAPIGMVFSVGVVMGFVVGMAICYQVLYADISDRLSEFATLKAMGYTDRALIGGVIEQSVYLAGLGYLAGLAVSVGAFRLVHSLTGLPMEFRASSAALVLALTLGMCVVSAVLASRKLVTADPAQLYQ